MPVGAPMGSSQMDNILTAIAVRFRDLMEDIANLNMSVNGQAAGLAYLQRIGYSNDPNPDNPGQVSNAALALQMIGYFSTVSGVSYGTVQQGGSDGTGAILFNFIEATAQLWSAQVVH